MGPISEKWEGNTPKLGDAHDLAMGLEGGGGSDLTGPAGQGEDNRRGREHHLSHTPADPFGVGGFFLGARGEGVWTGPLAS